MNDLTPAAFERNTTPEALAAWELYANLPVNPGTERFTPQMIEQDAFTAGFDAARWTPRTESEIDPNAVSAVLWFFGDDAGREPGNFTASLLEAMAHADASNLARLVAAFPHFGTPFLMAKSQRDGIVVLRGLVQVVAA